MEPIIITLSKDAYNETKETFSEMGFTVKQESKENCETTTQNSIEK